MSHIFGGNLLQIVYKALFVAAVVLFFCHPSFADSGKIYKLQIEGNRRIESAAILKAVKLKEGGTLFPEKVDEDVRAIYKMGYFEDVRGEIDRSDRGVILTYRVVEKPVLHEIKIEGNKEIAIDKIKETLEIKQNTAFTPKDLTRSIQKLKKLYSDEGYYLAEIESSVEKRSQGEVNVLLKIKEGKKTLIKTIRFEGNTVFPDKRLKKAMETSEKWMFSWLTGAGTYKEDAMKNDLNLIADVYFNEGYINVKVGDPVVRVLDDKSGLEVVIGITEGEQYKVGALAFKGDMLESAETFFGKMKIKSGDVFSRAVLRNDVITLTDFYADKGYAFANISPLTKVNPEARTIDITFDMEKGEKAHIDRINISGNTKTRDRIIRREVKLAEGDLYSSTALKKTKQNLMNLGYFEEVNLVTAKGKSEDELDLNIEVKEKATGTFNIGAGYSSLDGIIGQGSIQQANLFGLGLKGTLSAALGKSSQIYNIGLTDPNFLDTKWLFGGDLYRTERDYTDFSQRVTGGDIKGGYQLTDTLSTFLLYKLEKRDIYNLSASMVESIKEGTVISETSGVTSSVTASITSNTTDYRLDPSRGLVNTFSVEFAGLGGNSRFARYITDNSLYFPGGWGTVFCIHSNFGYIQAVGGREIPIDEKFFPGGIDTIRGYSVRTVSPYDPVGGNAKVFVGGTSQAIFNFEYIFPLLKDVGVKGVVFYDAGDAYRTAGELFSRFQTSFGIGIRWFSPIGPLRLEYGIPINPRSDPKLGQIDSTGGKFEFSIGGFF